VVAIKIISSLVNSLFPKPTINDPNALINATDRRLTRATVNFGYCEHDFAATMIDKAAVSFSLSPMSSGTTADEVSVKRFFKPISNQYQIGSCVANATADHSEAELARARNIVPEAVDDLSRMFIYWNARNNQFPPAANVDKGTYIALAFDCIKRYGAPAESVWPYDTCAVYTRPSPIAYRKAFANRLSTYYSINSTGDARLADIIRALNAGHSVVFGTKVGPEMRSATPTSVFGPPSTYLGGHAMVITGWSAKKNTFEIRNSWGAEWGDAGYTYFTPEYIKASMSHDFFVLTM